MLMGWPPRTGNAVSGWMLEAAMWKDFICFSKVPH